jgi:hypothetical protein
VETSAPFSASSVNTPITLVPFGYSEATAMAEEPELVLAVLDEVVLDVLVVEPLLLELVVELAEVVRLVDPELELISEVLLVAVLAVVDELALEAEALCDVVLPALPIDDVELLLSLLVEECARKPIPPKSATEAMPTARITMIATTATEIPPDLDDRTIMRTSLSVCSLGKYRT